MLEGEEAVGDLFHVVAPPRQEGTFYPFPRPNLNLNIWWQTLATASNVHKRFDHIDEIGIAY